ncbi:MAG: response regulator transcription factor [Candidatus Riflebacteria bacterium]|nr:response regulator transcription factor [Candidatus Riflebacteria bacterium]
MVDILCNTPGKISILVIDDHPVVRRGIRDMVSDEPDMVVTAEASNGSAALALLAKQTFDVVTLDLTLPEESGFEVLDSIKTSYPKLPVLIISMFAEEQSAVRALKAGAAGYLCKDTMANVLVLAIRKAANGGKFVTPTLAEQLALYLNTQERPLHENLSPREFRVMCMLATGQSLKQIGQILCLSIKTISTYKTRIFQKMQFKNTADLVKYSIRLRLVDDLLLTTKS